MHILESRRLDRPVGHRRRRRHPLIGLLAVAGSLGVLAAGCAEDPGASPPGSAPNAGSASDTGNVVKAVSGTPKKGGTLLVGLDAESEGLDPTDSRFAAATGTIARAVFDPLVTIGADFKPKPFLAESITPSNGDQTWTIKLRPNIKFHDGAALDSAALKKFFDKYKASARVGTALRPAKSIDIVDPLTVKLEMDQPWGTFPLTLAAQPGNVPAPSMLDNPNGKRNPVGTGPFKFVSWEQERAFIVEKNANYWRPDAIHLDKIEFRPIPDDQTRYQAFKAGSIDVMITPREPSIQNLLKDGAAGTSQYVRAKGDNDVNMLMMNTSKPPFDDIRLRQAVAYAMDRSQLLATNNSPPELAADSVYAKSSSWYVDAKFPTYDPAKAKQLVDAIEAEKGPIRLKLDTVPDQEVQKAVQIEQSLLQAVGIEVTINQTEQAELINRAVGGNYEFMTWRQFGGVDPDQNYVWWHSSYAEGGAALNMARNKDPEVDKALVEGRASADTAVRKKAYATVQQRHAEKLPYIWTTHLRWTMGANNKVRNIEASTFPDGSKSAGLVGGLMNVNEFWIE